MSRGEPKPIEETEIPQKSILVIGDWFIDENWLVAQHDAYNSSHTGDRHYVSIQESVHDKITGLCGAPQIIEVLRIAQKSHAPYTINSVGIWNEDDTDRLRCFMCHESTRISSEVNCTPYRLNTFTNGNQSAQNLDDLSEDGLNKVLGKGFCRFDANKNCCEFDNVRFFNIGDSNTSTNRIVRIFEIQSDSSFKLRSRFDWELSGAHASQSVLDESGYRPHLQIEQAIKNSLQGYKDKSEELIAIVLEDHNKGVVSKETIKTLFKVADKYHLNLNAVNWYVRSKVENPDWLAYLISEKKITVRLRTVDHQVAQKKGARRWNFQDRLGRASLELLGELSGLPIWEDGIVKEASTNNPFEYSFSPKDYVDKKGKVLLKYQVLYQPLPENQVQIRSITVLYNGKPYTQLEFRDGEYHSKIQADSIIKHNWTNLVKTRDRRLFSSSNLAGDLGNWTVFFKSQGSGQTPGKQVTSQASGEAEAKNDVSIKTRTEDSILRSETIIHKDATRILNIYEHVEASPQINIDYSKADSQTCSVGNVHTKRVAILFDDNTVIACHASSCFYIEAKDRPKQLVNIGRTTVFFASLIFQDLLDDMLDIPNNDARFGIHCKNAARWAHSWSKSSSDAWNAGMATFKNNYRDLANLALEVINASNASKANEADQEIENKNNPAVINQDQQKNPVLKNYFYAWNTWNASSVGTGIIKVKDDAKKKISKGVDAKFHLWRGQGAIQDYICIGGPKRNTINNLLASITQFNAQKEHQHPLNCLVIASPGWGKTTLAKAMARHCGMQFLDFSLSQMATTEELVDCFDSICSQQNRSNEKLLIFMDEVNCQIHGNSAMGLLLSPIWDGTFIRNGKYYALKPAVWIFASTDPVETLIKQNKGLDFISRLNGPIVELDSMKISVEDALSIRKYKEAVLNDPDKNRDILLDYHNVPAIIPSFVKTEQVYLMVFFLNQYHGPIKLIQEDLFSIFYNMITINGIRSIQFFAQSFINIYRGQVFYENMPSFDDHPELRRHIVLPEKWQKHVPNDRNKMVTIRTKPSPNKS